MFTLTQLAIAIALTAIAAFGFTLLVLWHMRDAARHDRDLAARERLQAMSLRTIAGAVYATSVKPYAPPAALYDEDETADDYEDDDYPHLKRRADDDTDRDDTGYTPQHYRTGDDEPADDLTEAAWSWWQPSEPVEPLSAERFVGRARVVANVHAEALATVHDITAKREQIREAKLACEAHAAQIIAQIDWSHLERILDGDPPFAAAPSGVYPLVGARQGPLEQPPSADVPKPSWSQMYEAAQRSKAGA